MYMKKIYIYEKVIKKLFIKRPKNGVRVLYTFKFQLDYNLHNTWSLGISDAFLKEYWRFICFLKNIINVFHNVWRKVQDLKKIKNRRLVRKKNSFFWM